MVLMQTYLSSLFHLSAGLGVELSEISLSLIFLQQGLADLISQLHIHLDMTSQTKVSPFINLFYFLSILDSSLIIFTLSYLEFYAFGSLWVSFSGKGSLI